ncbi:hypothetical protein [Paramagnetospirillum magneticum]|uniref:Transcriptional regulator n=1 Tax=Paramagnetospirillum magneticum (strain ATCC 700264 / AMB-1) TaxID=342108 RepID=Q2WA72_PARM1|nr:hypothetical protein [Paramagnetospirillum magneticum]BAE49253.1 hypothetical protein amb0449 [Paramagnetospirillum magneticum AMB-1]
MTVDVKTTAPATALGRARLAWGDDMPAWIEALARACDEASQKKVAARVGYSPATLSYVLNARYTGDLGAVEQAVKGALMAETVNCPVVGELACDACLVHQRAPWAPHNPQRIAFYRACRAGCPNSRIGGGNAQ